MKHAINLFLVIGALIGLFGQAAAFASIPSADAPRAAMAGMSDGCMKMMPEHRRPTDKPCMGMTLACIAAMGCTVPLTLAEPVVLPTAPPVAPPAPPMAAMRPLGTRIVAPEPEPPSLI